MLFSMKFFCLLRVVIMNVHKNQNLANKATFTKTDFLPFCYKVSAVGHAAIFAAINKYIPGLVI